MQKIGVFCKTTVSSENNLIFITLAVFLTILNAENLILILALQI